MHLTPKLRVYAFCIFAIAIMVFSPNLIREFFFYIGTFFSAFFFLFYSFLYFRRMLFVRGSMEFTSHDVQNRHTIQRLSLSMTFERIIPHALAEADQHRVNRVYYDSDEFDIE
jgi:hypothetical protein